MGFWRGWFLLVGLFKASETECFSSDKFCRGDQCYNIALHELKNFLSSVCKNAWVHVAGPWHMGKCKTKMLPVYIDLLQSCRTKLNLDF